VEGVQRGVPTRLDWRVGRRFRVLYSDPALEGECVSVTHWGKGKVRWVRLRLEDGSEKSYAPSHLALVG
jgi:hypothetical protein